MKSFMTFLYCTILVYIILKYKEFTFNISKIIHKYGKIKLNIILILRKILIEKGQILFKRGENYVGVSRSINYSRGT